MSNDSSLPEHKRRNYHHIIDAFTRILKEEGPRTFFRGVTPFVTRACLVGAVQIGTYDHFRQYYRETFPHLFTHAYWNVFVSAMTSGFIYSFLTMPLETAKNRMAFQRPDPITGRVQYTKLLATWKEIVSREGVRELWAGYLPYYLRCGLHTLVMFMSIEVLRKYYHSWSSGEKKEK
jgi:hypothetical protein